MGIGATAAMRVVAWFTLYAGGAVLLLAPIGWAIFGGTKYRSRVAYLRRLAPSATNR
jgi:hypothetical protein